MDELLNILSGIADDGNQSWRTLPPAAYHSDALFELERERIFNAGWICIGRADQVTDCGDYLSIDVVGEPLVMVRDKEGVLRVFSNVCRHRWMRVCQGAGNAGSLVCPYHAWTYNLDGSLRAAPEMDQTPDFDIGTTSLPQVHHEVWEGFVYVNLDGNAKPLTPQLQSITTRISEYKLDQWRVAATVDCGEYPWDWKVMQDNGECYHHYGAHSETFQIDYPARDVITECDDAWILQVAPSSKSSRRIGDDGLEYSPGNFEPGSGLADWQRTSFTLIYVLPNFFIYLQADMGMNLRMLPLGAGRIHLLADVILPPQAFMVSDFEQRLSTCVEFFKRFNEEDVAVNIGVQDGSHSKFAGSAPLSHLEAHNRHIAWWVASRLTKQVT